MLELGREWINTYRDLIDDFESVLKTDLSTDLDELTIKAEKTPNGKSDIHHKRVIRRLNIFIRICNELTRLEPDHSFAYFWRGVARAKLGDYTEASEDFNNAKAASTRMKKRAKKLEDKQRKEKEKNEHERLQHRHLDWTNKIRNLSKSIKALFTTPLHRPRKTSL